MRRRRPAATSDSAAVELTDLSTPPIPEPISESPAPAPTEEKPTRRRSPRRKADSVEVAAEPEPTPAPAPADEAPAPKRTIRRKKAEPVAAAEPAVEPEPTPAPVESEPSRTRRARRKAEAQAILAEIVPEAAEPAAAPAPVESAPETLAPTESRNRRRRGRRGGSDEPATPEPAAEALPAEETPKRVRGLRRTRTVAAPTLMVSEPTPTPVESEPEGEPGTESDDSRPRRVRGQRRGRREAATVVVAPPPVPVEPVPPPYQPLPAEVLANLPETKIAVRKGVAELLIQGEPRLPLLFFVNTEMGDENLAVAERQIRYAYDAGVRLFTVLAHLPWKNRAGERRFDLIEKSLAFVAQNAPDALILPRLIFSPPASWVRNHPGEMAQCAGSDAEDVSLGSRLFWEGEAEEAVRAAVEQIAQGPYAARIFGIYLEHGEWLHERGVGYDTSDANQQAFRSWLRARYKNSVVALRAAWYDGGVTFDNATVPTAPVPTGTTQFLSAKEGHWLDFQEYMSEQTAQVILRLSKAVKEASGGRTAVAASYGYTLELARAATGHLALGALLASPHLDILTAPVSYAGRLPGGSAPLPVPVGSVTLAGKLYISEDDTKTYLASGETPDSYNPKVETVEGTRAAHARNFGAALAQGAGLSWMDLWGEGWLDDRETWAFLGGLREVAEQYATRRRNPRTRANADPDVAVMVDERSFFSVRHEALLEQLIVATRDSLVRSGARIGFYLQSDLQRKNFPTSPRLMLFLNAFRLDTPTRLAIRERFQDDGRTLVWLYGPGVLEESLSELAEVVGMHLKLQPWASKAGTRIFSEPRSPLTEALRGQRIGEEMRCNPSLTVADSHAQVLGEYASGNPSIAVRKHPRWQSVFIGEPHLPLPLLRGLYRLAGVPIYTVDDDVAWVGDGILALHSAPGGGTTVYLPEAGVLHDFIQQETLSQEGLGARLSMPLAGTRLLYFGPQAEAERFGAEVGTAPMGLSASEVPTPTSPFVFEVEPRPAVVTEDDALFQEALAALPEVELLTKADDTDDAEAPVAGEAAPEAEGRGRRRRRRRGRGRGDEPGATPEAAADESGDAEPQRRPSLEELLPLSEVPIEGDLPPIPEELLPQGEETPAEGRPRRSRRGGTRRRRNGGGDTPAEPPAPEAE